LKEEILESHKRYLERAELYRDFGYDLDKERDFILKESLPIFGKILEAGTGKGHFALCLARAGYSFVTFDISSQEQHIAKLNVAYFGFDEQVDFRIENGERTGFPDAGFDTVFSVNVLHHLIDPYRAIDELIRLTSIQGKLIVADFTEDGFRIMDKIHNLEGNTHEMGKVSLTDVQEYLKERGFLIKKASSVYQCVLVTQRSGFRDGNFSS
jgi:ubiquinone/menaquinone biosynthesis C-methylase UbiE